MNNPNYKYYKGFLACQFEIDKLNKLNSSAHYWGNYKLLPRFKFYDFVEIDESEYLSQINNEDRRFISHREISPVEFYFESNSFRKFAKEIYLTPSIKNNSKDDLNAMNWDISSRSSNEYEESFVTKYQQSIHGIIQGKAYLLCDHQILSQQNFEDNNGCLNAVVSVAKPIVDRIFYFNSKIKRLLNLASNKLFGTTIINDLENNAGCFNPLLPTGCTSSGCSSFGCGCLSLMIGLLILLFGIASLFKSCHHMTNALDTQKVIRDTIFVEKMVYDTVKVTKTDTLKFENNITKTNYETVNLPNVQFKTNEAELLEGSYKDIDALIDYMKKNNQMESEIVGHTDNVGDPNFNLALSQKRAEKIRDYMISKGISPDKIKAIGKGDTEPKTSNDSPEGRMMNRRVEVKLKKKQIVKTEKKQIKS